MRINRENYKDWYNLFLKGELKITDEEYLMKFLEENPDLILEDDIDYMSLQPEGDVIYNNKEKLKKESDDLSDIPEIELLAIKRLEGKLSEDEVAYLTSLSISDPDKYSEIEIYQTLKLKADHDIIYRNKQQLKRYTLLSKKYLYGLTSSAAVIIMVLFYLFNLNSSGDHTYYSENKNDKKIEKQVVNDNNIEKKVPENEQNTSEDSIKNNVLIPIKTNKKKQSVEPLIELDEPLMALMQKKDIDHAIEQVKINGYEAALNEMMPLYLDNQIKIKQLEDLMAETEYINHKDKNLTLLEKGIQLTNIFTRNKLKLNKYYDENGNLIAYKLKGEGLEWTKKVNE